MTPEGIVKKKVSSLLKKYGAYYEMPVPIGFGKSGLDYIGCIAGRFFVVETKAGYNLPTPRQLITIQNVRNAGGMAFVVNEIYGFDDLENWLEKVTEEK